MNRTIRVSLTLALVILSRRMGGSYRWKPAMFAARPGAM